MKIYLFNHSWYLQIPKILFIIHLIIWYLSRNLARKSLNDENSVRILQKTYRTLFRFIEFKKGRNDWINIYLMMAYLNLQGVNRMHRLPETLKKFHSFAFFGGSSPRTDRFSAVVTNEGVWKAFCLISFCPVEAFSILCTVS